MIPRFLQSLIDWRNWLLIFAIALGAGAYWQSNELSFDRSIENMFGPDDPLLVPYRQLKQTFGGNEIVLAVYRDEQLLALDGQGLKRLSAVSRQLKAAPGVRDVLSLAEVNATLEHLERFSPKKFTGPAILNPDSPLSAEYRELFAGYTHSIDGTTAAIAVMLIPEEETTDPRRATIDALRQTIEQLPDGLAPGMLAGEPVMVADGFRYIEADGRRLAISSTILLAITIFLCFRSVRWVLIPLAVVQWTLIVTQATLAASGLRLSMVSSMLTAIVTVVGIATVVHILVRFREEMRSRDLTGPPQQRSKRALLCAGVVLIAPIIWSCLTDAVGFGSLLAARVGPVQDFGLMTALGSLLVLVAVALLVPGLALLGNFDTQPKQAWGEASLDRQLTRLLTWVEHHPRWLLLITLVTSIVAIVGSLRIEVETDFTKNFRANSPVVQSYAFIESQLGGAGVWDVMVPAPATIDEKFLARVSELEDQLRALQVPAAETGEPIPALTKVISLADADAAAKASPALALLSPELRAQGMQTIMPTFAAALRNTKPAADGNYYLRIMLRARERQSATQKKWLIAEVTRLSQAAFPTEGERPAAQVTGFFVLLTHLIDSLLADQWLTFGIAAGGIWLMLIVALRSVKLSLIALVPNALPIFFTLGIVGWLGLKMNMGAAMIAAVSMGLSVDSSIHYILSYQRAVAGGKNVLDALHVAQQGVGRAMVFSTLALIVGFSVLATSEFIPTIYFGALVSLAMFGGLLGNLIVLPLLIRLTTKNKQDQEVVHHGDTEALRNANARNLI
ncbi:MAG TPA: MMPL family transporter [Pirellulaceae bacterium]|nr:MMPL family transporter [Pirellulaceae bacterium]